MKKDPLTVYNKIVSDIGSGDRSITAAGNAEWNLRDMVSECQAQLDTFSMEGHANRHLHETDHKAWQSFTSRLRRFILANRKEAMGMVCSARHGSCFD